MADDLENWSFLTLKERKKMPFAEPIVNQLDTSLSLRASCTLSYMRRTFFSKKSCPWQLKKNVYPVLSENEEVIFR